MILLCLLTSTARPCRQHPVAYDDQRSQRRWPRRRHIAHSASGSKWISGVWYHSQRAAAGVCFFHHKFGSKCDLISCLLCLPSVFSPFHVHLPAPAPCTSPSVCSYPRLCVFRRLANCRILVAGGDGTVNWVLNGVAELKAACPDLASWSPAVAILPVGTGASVLATLQLY